MTASDWIAAAGLALGFLSALGGIAWWVVSELHKHGRQIAALTVAVRDFREELRDIRAVVYRRSA